MDSLKDWLDLTHAVGSPLAGIAIVFVYRATRTADRILDALVRIEDGIKVAGSRAERTGTQQNSKLDQIHEDVLSIPLNVLRARK